jgi:hypothetical protein
MRRNVTLTLGPAEPEDRGGDEHPDDTEHDHAQWVEQRLPEHWHALFCPNFDTDRLALLEAFPERLDNPVGAPGRVDLDDFVLDSTTDPRAVFERTVSQATLVADHLDGRT